MINSHLIKTLLAICIGLSCACAYQANAALAASSVRYVDFNEWTLACDNAGDCQAIGFDESAESLSMRIDRAAGANGAISIVITSAGSLPLDKFFIDEKKLKLSPQVWVSSKDDDNEISINNKEAALNFIAFIRSAKRIGFFNSNSAENSLSLKGLSASLLLIDEIQGRLYSQQAFISKGNKSETSVPPSQPLPKLIAAAFRGKPVAETQTKIIIDTIRKHQAALLLNETCDSFDKDDSDDEVSLLSASEAIALIECSRGAYQSYFLAFRVPIKNPKKSSLLRLPGLPGEALEINIGNASYDPTTATLSSYGKGRGLFDCGESIDWVFDGKNFHLSQYRLQKRCGGMRAPGDFPTLWRTKK